MKDNSILSITLATDQNDRPTVFLYLSAEDPQSDILKGVMGEFLATLEAVLQAFPIQFHHLGRAFMEPDPAVPNRPGPTARAPETAAPGGGIDSPVTGPATMRRPRPASTASVAAKPGKAHPPSRTRPARPDPAPAGKGVKRTRGRESD
jgi:hypothetical protein